MIISTAYAAFNYLANVKVPQWACETLEEPKNLPKGLGVKFSEDKRINRLIDKQNLGPNVKVLEARFCPMAASTGTRLSTAIITYSPNLKKFDPKFQNFVLLHEAGHIKNEDPLVHTAVFSTALFACEYFSTLFSIQSLALLTALSGLSNAVGEYRADSYAREQATTDELIAARTYFEAKHRVKQDKWDQSSQLLDKLALLAENFSYYIMQGHPTNEMRKTWVEQELISRGHPVEDWTQKEQAAIAKVQKTILDIELKEAKLTAQDAA